VRNTARASDKGHEVTDAACPAPATHPRKGDGKGAVKKNQRNRGGEQPRKPEGTDKRAIAERKKEEVRSSSRAAGQMKGKEEKEALRKDWGELFGRPGVNQND